jgi:ribonuclease HI
MTWTTYTDGACAPSNPGPAGWGAVVIAPLGGGVSEHYGFIGPGTNQIAELTAALEGLQKVPLGEAVELVSDSQYVLKGLSEWRSGWERRGFKNAKGEIVANLELWQKLFLVADARRVTVRWVRGHNGDHYNERADALANKALALRAGSAPLP